MFSRQLCLLESLRSSAQAEVDSYRRLHANMREIAAALSALCVESATLPSLVEPAFDRAACSLDTLLSTRRVGGDIATDEDIIASVAGGLCRLTNAEQLVALLPAIAIWISDHNSLTLVVGCLRILFDACNSFFGNEELHPTLFRDRVVRRHWRSIAASCQELQEVNLGEHHGFSSDDIGALHRQIASGCAL